MPFQSVPATAGVELIYDQLNNSVENTLYVWKNALLDWSESDLEDLADAIETWWDTEMKPLQASSVTLREIVCRGLALETSPVVDLAVGVAGSIGGAILPGNVTWCASFRTNSAGRSYRGRNYFIGLDETRVSGDIVGTATLLAIIDAYAALPTYLTAANPEFVWVVVSREHDGAPREFGEITPITSVIGVDDIVDSQRRRLSGRGE